MEVPFHFLFPILLMQPKTISYTFEKLIMKTFFVSD